MAPPSKICLIKLGAIGDVVNSLPLVNRMRLGWPQARISWVIAPLAHGLVEGHEAVDEFLLLDLKQRSSVPGFLRNLRSERFDLVIDLQRILKSGLITGLSGADRRLGFDRARCKEFSWLFTRERIAPNPAPGVTVAQYLEFADHLGLPPTHPTWGLPHQPWTKHPPAVCLNLGASKAANLWPLKHWSLLTRRLAEHFGPQRIALCGGPQDREAASKIQDEAPPGVLNTVGELSLKESAGLIGASQVFVACDTGPLHMAVAMGTPLVALFGAADPGRTGPFERQDSVLFKPATCSPCRKRECVVDGHPCMTDITVDLVLARILEQAK